MDRILWPALFDFSLVGPRHFLTRLYAIDSYNKDRASLIGQRKWLIAHHLGLYAVSVLISDLCRRPLARWTR